MGTRSIPERGDVFEWQGVRMEVLYVDAMLRYAEVSCSTGESTYQKKEPLPLPAGARKVQN